MLLLALLLFPLTFAVEGEKTISNDFVSFDVYINNKTLERVEVTEEASEVLDLSNLGLEFLEAEALNNLTTLKTLNLANNSLSTIPEEAFFKLVNLEHLDLANNNINGFKKGTFSALQHLKTLNISNNRFEKLGNGEFLGLPNSSVIFTEGMNFRSINTNVFGPDPKNPDSDEDEDVEIYLEDKDDEDDEDDEDDDVDEDDERIVIGRNLIDIDDPEEGTDKTQRKGRKRSRRRKFPFLLFTVCIEGGVLTQVKVSEKEDIITHGCRRMVPKDGKSLLELKNLGISKFEKGWCQLASSSITKISFEGNNITQVTRELLNDLPKKITRVNLSGNKIDRLERGIIENKYIQKLLLNANNLSEIEEGALAEMKLKAIFLADNQLKDTKFIASLPNNVRFISLTRNKIAEISPGSFSNKSELLFLIMKDNLIQEVKTDSLLGLEHLIALELSNNRITNIQPGSFQPCPFVKSLSLRNNSISGFEKGVFNYLHSFIFLDVGYNQLSNIKENFPDGLPPDLRQLTIDYNNIRKLENDSFIYSPKRKLSLDGNKISEIELGTFDLPELVSLNLNNITLMELDPDLFQGLERIKHISLMGNGITRIPKGLTKNLADLKVLNLGSNPIKRLENGTLYGFRRSRDNSILLNHVPVEVIEGGLFDDV